MRYFSLFVISFLGWGVCAQIPDSSNSSIAPDSLVSVGLSASVISSEASVSADSIVLPDLSVSPVLKFSEFLGYVKRYHPIAKQAQLTLEAAQANLMRSRGGFDPKIEVDYENKEFKGTEYYDRLNATFKVPVWFGLDVKGNFEQNSGENLNPSEDVPSQGLYSAGIAVSLGEGLWINDRMATLKQAKLFKEQTAADFDLLVNQVLFDASSAYFQWLKAYLDLTIFNDFLNNAQIRFDGVKSSAAVGEVAAIDTVEAKIVVQNRRLDLEQAKLDFTKTSLELSNFLWIGDNIPMELQQNTIPDTELIGDIDMTLNIEGNPLNEFTLENHPKLISLRLKRDGLEVDQRLKTNKLLPQIDLEYNFLTETPELINSFESQEYKGKVTFRMPLFLRKERGDLKLAKLKVRDAGLELDNTEIRIKNDIEAIYTEQEVLQSQNSLIVEIVENYQILLAAEERKFGFGESSLFLVNARESKLIDGQLKRNSLLNKYYLSKAKLFKSLAINPAN